jgi:hypothetical protein
MYASENEKTSKSTNPNEENQPVRSETESEASEKIDKAYFAAGYTVMTLLVGYVLRQNLYLSLRPSALLEWKFTGGRAEFLKPPTASILEADFLVNTFGYLSVLKHNADDQTKADLEVFASLDNMINCKESILNVIHKLFKNAPQTECRDFFLKDKRESEVHRDNMRGLCCKHIMEVNIWNAVEKIAAVLIEKEQISENRIRNICEKYIGEISLGTSLQQFQL